MQSTASIISKLKINYPQFVFKEANRFLWAPNEQTVYYSNKIDNCSAFLFHELSHAILDHNNYNFDVELIAMERDAWDTAVKIASNYNIKIKDNIIQLTLDTYRDWLHKRSTCPACSATGIQSNKNQYKCLACGNEWRVNEARICALKRYKICK